MTQELVATARLRRACQGHQGARSYCADAPTLGLLLCESRSGSIVEYALRDVAKPIGVSTYRVTGELPESLQAEVPSIEDLQDVVEKLRPNATRERRGVQPRIRSVIDNQRKGRGEPHRPVFTGQQSLFLLVSPTAFLRTRRKNPRQRGRQRGLRVGQYSLGKWMTLLAKYRVISSRGKSVCSISLVNTILPLPSST